jgi:DNA-damage-inducible protein J
MAKSATIRARTEPDVKVKAEAVMHELGLNPSAVITMLYKAIIRLRRLPFEPNATTLAALEDARLGRDLIRAESMDDLFVLLEEPDEQPGNGDKVRHDQAVRKRFQARGKTRARHRASS